MATNKDLAAILKRLDTIDDKLKALPKLDKKISQIQKDIDLIKQCVSVENAKQFPAKVRKVAGGGRRSSGFPVAASPLK